jgi:hypothetical protein
MTYIIDYFLPISHPCLGSPPPMGSFFLLSKRNKKHWLKIFLSKQVRGLGQWSPIPIAIGMLGRFQ